MAPGPSILVDAHCHFERQEFAGRRAALLEECALEGIQALVMPGTVRAEWPLLEALAAEHDALYYAPGLHPWWADEHQEHDLEALDQWLQQRREGRQGQSRLLAVGECGLDRLKGDLARQQPWFEAQVSLAKKYQLPLLIHSVRTHDSVLSVLKRAHYAGPALLHGFSGNYQQASQLIDHGLYLGVTGTITHERASKTRDALSRVPIESLVLETDAPDMPLAGMARGQNSPLALTRILASLCQLRPEAPATIRQQLLGNVQTLYGRDFAEKPAVNPGDCE
ncbi:MAG: TatD family deoxyribonuclease [Halomonadaceae bacterium]|nr:MAG: TatD family deoxyribonuclease [Halomonadaceae bacterium]